MNKIKLILPLTGLATIPAIVMPLTSCNKNSSYDLVLNAEQIKGFKPYDKKYDKDTVKIQDAMENYISHLMT